MCDAPLPNTALSFSPKRLVVERTFAWLVQYRRLRSDYEINMAHSEAMVYVAMIRLMLRRLGS